VLYAATAPGVTGGEVYGPRGLLRGRPTRFRAPGHAAGGEVGRRLWEVSADLTGVAYPAQRPLDLPKGFS
jgi:hypothetical protein